MSKPFIIIVVFVVISLIFTLIFLNPKSKDKAKTIELDCTNGYTMLAKYHTPDGNGIFSKLSLVIIKDNKKDSYEMNTAMSASGAKFETSNSEYFLWEHQGIFRFGRSGQDITECKQR
ncbi:MAG: hypothetical protein WCQ53_06495 [bacterium]